jgi:hypothetical protein
MTRAEELLASCKTRDIRIFVRGENALTIDAKPGTLTPQIVEEIKILKPELVALLSLLNGGQQQAHVAQSLVGPTSPFSNWLYRPDANGRLGLERPSLPESARWWARTSFIDITASSPLTNP